MKSSTKRAVCLGLGFLFIAPWTALAAIGVKGGLSFALQRQGGATQQVPQVGFLGGILLMKTMNPYFTVQSEIMIIQKASKKTMDSGYAVTTTLTCVDIALISKIHPFESKNVQACFLFGPFASYIISGKYDYGEYRETIKDYEKLEAGMIFGLGADLALGPRKVVLDLRYNLGWTDVHKVPSRIWNRGFFVAAGIVF